MPPIDREVCIQAVLAAAQARVAQLAQAIETKQRTKRQAQIAAEQEFIERVRAGIRLLTREMNVRDQYERECG